jgi:uncharacterized cupredoxin-like copper-binding protein
MTNRLPILALAAALAGCATSHPITPRVESAAGAFADAAPVEVTLENFDFNPSTLHLRAGRPYRLELHNAAGGGHDFSAPEFFAAARIAPADAATVARGEVELTGGKSVTVHLIPAAGHYKLVCTHLGHAVLGMKGEIVVD